MKTFSKLLHKVRPNRSQCFKARRNILTLPYDVLEQILTVLSPWNRRRLRATCRSAKAIHDHFTWHRFKVKRRQAPHPLLEVVKIATIVYQQIGFFPVFLDKISHIMSIDAVTPYMLQYFQRPNQFLDSLSARFYFLATFLNLLKFNRNAILVPQELEGTMVWGISIRLPHTKIEIWREKSGLPFGFPLATREILLTMMHLLYASRAKRNTHQSLIFADGVVSCSSNFNEELIIKVSIYGSHKVGAFLDRFLTHGRGIQMAPEEFTAVLSFSNKSRNLPLYIISQQMALEFAQYEQSTKNFPPPFSYCA